MPSIATLDPENADLLVRLKEPPVPDSPALKLLIEILEEDGSLEDFHLWGAFEHLVSTGQFVAQNIKELSFITNQSIASKIQSPAFLPSFKVPKEVLREIKKYLTTLGKRTDEFNNRFSAKKVLDILPYWPYVLWALEMMWRQAASNARGWNKRRWANTLRDLRADDCPLGENSKEIPINQYRMALAIADEFKDLPKVIDAWKQRLGLPKNHKRGWVKIIKPLVNHLNPFFPVTRNGKRYVRSVKVNKHVERDAVSRETFQVTANLLHFAYPILWPKANANRVRSLFHKL